jgi:D-alanine-D-alanine ligase
MKVAIVHNAIAENETDPATLDVLEQAEFIAASLKKNGHRVKRFGFTRDVRLVMRALRSWRAERIFNLVESLEGYAALHPCAAGLWELMGIPHTGSPSWALQHGTDKHIAKVILSSAGLPTPAWAVCGREDGDWSAVPGPWIVKPGLEDASVGIDEESVVHDAAAARARVAYLREAFPGQPILVEQYIDGREFNISVMATPEGPRVLSPAEMRFVDYPPGKARVLGYRAKWTAGAFEFEHTERTFDFGPGDAPLLETMKDIARRCWRLFDLHGYARVDLRADKDSRPYVIEINPNPCLSPDAGFAAAVARAGIPPEVMARNILEDCVCLPRRPTTN